MPDVAEEGLLSVDRTSIESSTSSSYASEIASRILRGVDYQCYSYAIASLARDAPTHRAHEIEIDDRAPCDALLVEGGWRVKKLELCVGGVSTWQGEWIGARI